MAEISLRISIREKEILPVNQEVLRIMQPIFSILVKEAES